MFWLTQHTEPSRCHPDPKPHDNRGEGVAEDLKTEPGRGDGGAAAEAVAEPDIEHADRFEKAGCAGVDLLAYRATEADPIELVRAARKAMKGVLLVAGSVDGPARVRELKDAGADAFTVGSAAFDLSFAPGKGTLRAQLEAILDATS